LIWFFSHSSAGQFYKQQKQLTEMETELSVSLNESARAMGRKGGRAKTDAKLLACKKNSTYARGLVAQMAKHLYGRNLRADDQRIFAIKNDLSRSRKTINARNPIETKQASTGADATTCNLE
jgi:hypothetical protein